MRAEWVCGACLVMAASVAGADPLDMYLGTGVGYATLQQPLLPANLHPTGWKLFAGWRPIEILGAEVEYLDLGSRNGTYDVGTLINSERASGNAVTAFAVGYLPQPLPYLDLYGKLGIARLRLDVSNTFAPNCQQVCPQFVGLAGANQSATRFAYGGGVQFRFGAELVRLEYQGFSTPGGDQSLLSLEVSFNF